MWFVCLVRFPSMHHAPRSSCKTNHSTQSVKPFPTVGWKGKLLFFLLSIHSLLYYALCTHAPRTIYATLLCMHNQQTNRVFPSPRLGLVLHNSRQLGWNSGPPTSRQWCVHAVWVLPYHHSPTLINRPNLPYLCHQLYS